ncbi:MAG: hypothetical protein RLZZ518_472, partial [Actinomycetota bacterium]
GNSVDLEIHYGRLVTKVTIPCVMKSVIGLLVI